MPAVSAIAKAPQNVTRTVALSTLAPPIWAPIAPRNARKINEAAETAGISQAAGDRAAVDSGRAAPTAKVAAEVNAAWIGRAAVISDMPS